MLRHAFSKGASLAVGHSARTAAARRPAAAWAAAALGGAAAAIALSSPAQSQSESKAGWFRLTAPSAEERAAEKAAETGASSTQAGYALKPIVVTISGAAGQIGYSEHIRTLVTLSSASARPPLTPAACTGLLPLICSGQVFGPDRPVSLRLLDIDQSMGVLRGVVMEIEDAAYPLVENVYVRFPAP